MLTSKGSLQARASGRPRKDLRPAIGLEPLEARTLLSGWATVDDYQYSIPGWSVSTGARALAVDSAGDIYDAGNAAANLDRALVRKSSDHGATWSAPMDDFRVDGSSSTDIAAIATDPTGNLVFTAGSYRDASGNSRWFVRRSQDAGVTWSTVDQFSLGGTADDAMGITIDAAGTVYAVGRGNPSGTSSSSKSWVVRRSRDGGTTWSTVDTVGAAGADGVFVHPTAGLFVVGNAIGGLRNQYQVWTVRRSLDGGDTWSTVDTFQLDPKLSAYGHAIGMDAAGNLYAVGSAAAKDGALYWGHSVVRKSTDGGKSWTTADNFQLQQKGSTEAWGFAKDSAGSLYVAGVGQVNGVSHWVVRKNPGGTGSWTTDDDFQFTAGSGSSAAAVAADSAGHVFVAGSGASTNGAAHWIVRSSPVPTATASSSTTTTTATSSFSTTPISGGTLQVDPALDLSSGGALLA